MVFTNGHNRILNFGFLFKQFKDCKDCKDYPQSHFIFWPGLLYTAGPVMITALGPHHGLWNFILHLN